LINGDAGQLSIVGVGGVEGTKGDPMQRHKIEVTVVLSVGTILQP